MMKKKHIITGTFVWAVCFLAGCGDGAINWEDVVAAPPGPVKVTAEAVEEAQPDRMEILLQKYGTADFMDEDYIELADLYLLESRNKEARDVLELGCRLIEHPTAYEMLQGITVNLEEESNAIQDMAGRLLQNLNAEELFSEAVAMLYHRDWLETMMPKMESGKRNYYLETEQQTLLIQTGFDAYGAGQTILWLGEGNEIDVCCFI